LTPKQQEHLKAKVAKEAFRTIHDAVHWVRATFGVEYTCWGVRSLFERLQIKRAGGVEKGGLDVPSSTRTFRWNANGRIWRWL